MRSQEIRHISELRLIHKAEPQYTKEARAAKIQGEVFLSLMIGVDGVPSDIKVDRGLGMGLDEKAVECLQQWRFKPAIDYFGEPVSGKAKVVMNFRLLSR